MNKEEDDTSQDHKELICFENEFKSVLCTEIFLNFHIILYKMFLLIKLTLVEAKNYIYF